MKSKMSRIAAVCVLIFAVMCVPGYKDTVSYVWNASSMPLVVLDPGHGGVDGGAQSIDGTVERDINLDLAKKLKKQLEAENIRVVMTRDTNEGLYGGEENGSIRSLKVKDSKERKRIIDDSGADLTVSIHLNSFIQDRSVRGAQVFYPSEGDRKYVERSKEAALVIQETLNGEINIGNEKEAAEKSDVFIMKEIKSAVVIVECGFLSNHQEAAKLKNGKYQKRISKILATGICRYLRENDQKTSKSIEISASLRETK